MSKQADGMREQARRAERLALTVSDNEASKTLKGLALQLDQDADALDRANERRGTSTS